MDQSTSRIERTLIKDRPLWVRLVISLFFLLLPIVAAYLDGVLDEFLREGQWRVLSLAPIIILYIWFIAPAMSRGEAEVVRSMRPLVPLEAEDFSSIVERESRVDPRHEWLAIGLGAVLGFVSAQTSGFDMGVSWLAFYWFLSLALMYGLLAWVILGTVASTRLNAAIHRQSLRVDILDPTQFEAIGRLSLLLALVFIGGITLSLVITFQPENISEPSFWLTYLLLVLAILLIFFLNMRPTHRLLSAARLEELEPLQRQINLSCRELVRRLEVNQDPDSLPTEINALIAYEQRLLAARTWPYNTTMLRTLFFSVFIPLGSVLARLLVEVFLR
jgi:hypothetical protein